MLKIIDKRKVLCNFEKFLRIVVRNRIRSRVIRPFFRKRKYKIKIKDELELDMLNSYEKGLIIGTYVENKTSIEYSITNEVIKTELRQRFNDQKLIKLYNLIDKLLTDEEWENWGYNSTEPCYFCKNIGDNKSEPRFSYTVCRNHVHLNPIINKN